MKLGMIAVVAMMMVACGGTTGGESKASTTADCTVYPAGAAATGNCIPVADQDGGAVQCCAVADPLACLSGCEAASDETTASSFDLKRPTD